MLKALRLAPLLLLALAALAPADEDAALLAELDAALLKQAPFKTVVTYASKEVDAAGTLTIHYSPKAGRLFLDREGTSPRPVKSFALIELGSATYWSAEGGQRLVYDLGPLLKGLHAFMNAAALSEGGEALSREAFEAKVGMQLQIGIGAKAMETRPELRVGLAVTTLSRSSWTAELRDAPKRKLVASKGEVEGERPGGWSYVIDRKTGFFRSQRLVLQSSTFTLEASPLESAEFPEPKPPAKIPTQELPIHVFVSMLRTLVTDSLALGGAAAEGAALERAAQGYTSLAAAAAETRLHHLARSEARRYLRYRLQTGASLADLRGGVEGEAARFGTHLAKGMAGIEREEERELASLRKAALAGVAADSPRAKALGEALSVERVRAARGKPASPKSHLEAVLATLH